MSKTTLLTGSVAGVLCLGLLAGCGSDTSTTTTTESSTASASDAASDGPSGSGGGGGMGGECTVSATTPTAAPADAVPQKADEATVATAVEATQAFLDTLSADEQAAVLFDYTDLDAKRCSWSNFPDAIFQGREGARMGDLTEDQRAAALAAVESLMTAAGYTYVEQAMEGDNQLAATDSSAQFGDDNYHLALYGDPSTTDAWTLQFGGHHLAIHVSVGGDTLSVSPYFKGAQPISYELDGETIQPMGQVADDFFGIFEAMDEDQLASAELADAYDDLVMGPGTDTGFPETEGVAFGDLSAEQQELVKGVINDYVADYAPELAGPLVDLYISQLEETTVSWSGTLDRDEQIYLRIDGPRLWIEWVNTYGPGSDGVHYHTVYRDKMLDYGTGTTAE